MRNGSGPRATRDTSGWTNCKKGGDTFTGHIDRLGKKLRGGRKPTTEQGGWSLNGEGKNEGKLRTAHTVPSGRKEIKI